MDEVRLAKIVPKPLWLMMNVVVINRVREDAIYGINPEREIESAVVVDRLESRQGEYENSLPDGQAAKEVSGHCATCVHHQTFKPMVVDCTNCMSHNQLVVIAVHMLVQKSTFVEEAVHKVLVRVQDEAARAQKTINANGMLLSP